MPVVQHSWPKVNDVGQVFLHNSSWWTYCYYCPVPVSRTFSIGSSWTWVDVGMFYWDSHRICISCYLVYTLLSLSYFLFRSANKYLVLVLLALCQSPLIFGVILHVYLLGSLCLTRLGMQSLTLSRIIQIVTKINYKKRL